MQRGGGGRSEAIMSGKKPQHHQRCHPTLFLTAILCKLRKRIGQGMEHMEIEMHVLDC